jgi:3-deoxy-7-phosphoheptulonate synthase
MNLSVIKQLPGTEEIIRAYPLSDMGYEQVAHDIQEVKNILSGRDGRILIIVGPCSAWPHDAVMEYASRLKKLNKKVSDKLKLVMRVYIQKPRTSKGWTGPVNQPDPFAPPNIEEGIRYSRSLMVKIIEMGLPIADEAVFTHNAKGFIELLSWVAIGARSTEDQEHRIFASAIECPVGMKNPTSGSIEIGVNSIIAAQHGHTAVFNGAQVETHGNPYAHLVLRGGLDHPNYHVEDIYQARRFMEMHKISNPAIVIDASHDNCKIDGKKDPIQQINVAQEVMAALKLYPELGTLVKGFMFESFLKNGYQKLENLTTELVDRDGLSITDPCLSWEQTESLITEIASQVKSIRKAT